MSEKKLVIKLKYGASAPRDKRPHPSLRPPDYEWNYKRIALVLGIGLIGLVWLTYFIIDAPENRVAKHGAESKATTATLNRSSQPVLSTSDRQTASGRSQQNSRTEEPQTVSRSGTDVSPHAEGSHENRSDAEKSKQLVRAQFAWGIKDKEPTGEIGSPAILRPSDSVTLYFFSELEGMNGQSVSHRWSHDGRVALIKEFEIRGENWRVFSSKQLNTKLLGEWKVTVRDSRGQDLGEFVLNVLKPTKLSR